MKTARKTGLLFVVGSIAIGLIASTVIYDASAQQVKKKEEIAPAAPATRPSPLIVDRALEIEAIKYRLQEYYTPIFKRLLDQIADDIVSQARNANTPLKDAKFELPLLDLSNNSTSGVQVLSYGAETMGEECGPGQSINPACTPTCTSDGTKLACKCPTETCVFSTTMCAECPKPPPSGQSKRVHLIQ